MGKHLYKRTEEHKAKLAEANRGKTHTDEAKAKMRKPRDEAFKQKMREYHGDRPAEHNANISSALKGRTLSEETKQKMRKPRSEEAKARIAAAAKARWAKVRAAKAANQ